MGALEDWEVSPPAGLAAPEAEMLESAAELLPPGPSPYRLIAAILIRLVERIDDPSVYALAEQVAREEGRKLVLSYRGGGLDFAAAVRALVEELRRFSPQAQIVRMTHEYAEIDTPDCPFRDIALEHSDLVAVIDPALKEGAMAALGHPSDVEVESSVARGDASCREIIRRRDDDTRSLPATAK
jgi:predicted ArsR family transcriptional regulator